jgi:pimeloyl-ACP methyl ester carboxylesterase
MRAFLVTLLAIVVPIACGLWLASAPDIPRAELEARYATPPSKFLTLEDGTRVHYRDRGPRSAPAVVLLHGFSGSLFAFEAWSRALSDRFRVISIDLPGSGLTGAVGGGDYGQGAMTAFVKDVADRLGLGRFALAGNSMGGGVAARFAELYGARVTALILIDAPGPRLDAARHEHLRYYFAHVPLLSDAVLILRPPGDLNRMAGTRAAMLAHFRLPEDDFVWQHVRAIRAPTLVVWGANDRTIPLAVARAWVSAIPGAKLALVAGAGHTPMSDKPGESVSLARGFLNATLD